MIKTYTIFPVAFVMLFSLSGCYWKRSCKSQVCKPEAQAPEAAHVKKHKVAGRQSGPMPKDAGVVWSEADQE